MGGILAIRKPKVKPIEKLPSEGKIFCHKCGAANDIDAVFCSSCGNKIVKVSELVPREEKKPTEIR